MAYANEGRKVDAIREAKTAESLLPMSKDALGGVTSIWFLARTYMLMGEPEPDRRLEVNRPVVHR